jgi:hypothetical protein
MSFVHKLYTTYTDADGVQADTHEHANRIETMGLFPRLQTNYTTI